MTTKTNKGVDKHLKAKISRGIFWLSSLFILGIVGGIERGLCGTGHGIALITLASITGVLAAFKGGMFRINN